MSLTAASYIQIAGKHKPQGLTKSIIMSAQIFEVLWPPVNWLKLFNSHGLGARGWSGLLLCLQRSYPGPHDCLGPQWEGAGASHCQWARFWWAAHRPGEAPEQQQCCHWNLRLVLFSSRRWRTRVRDAWTAGPPAETPQGLQRHFLQTSGAWKTWVYDNQSYF